MSTKRWIEAGSDASEFERALLASGLDADPPAEAEGAVWHSVASTLGVPLPPVAATTSAAASVKALTSVSALVTLGKGFALGVAVSLGLVGVARLETARAPDAQPTRAPLVRSTRAAVTQESGTKSIAAPNPLPELPRTAVSTLVAEAARGELPATDPSPRAPSPPRLPEASAPVTDLGPTSLPSVAAFPIAAPRGPSPQAEREHQSQLEEEALLLRRARAELRANRIAAAFATLEASREKFSLPELRQEREALLIELLFRSGERARGVEKARRFLVQYPQSPHAAQVRSIAEADAR